ncbi:hypothetical protein acsn021_07750 [Anaerocolumna cellulosilytica]|uniref:Uncharacterized protein n=1 Tax=Anaerocolumna cellulosilytica TaxID=433286 RepID=A0A6S6QU56_9FIRM|nr:acyl-CoA thioesterase [Anaerocolumna cellulosilytica]MBB5197631.1 acyl-CoA thioesterase FadM [Anaerocolumna cellulosilytica]BCJ93206.1 hypothetical protein acsn021_07750 [Anaerocolumna cellulosilytica]
MLIPTYVTEHTVKFSECNYYGMASNYTYMCWFEDARLLISEVAGIQGFFYKEHRSNKEADETINKTKEYFTMPVLQNRLYNFRELAFGTKILVHTWLEEPTSAYTTFNHCITSKDRTIKYAACEAQIGLMGEKSGLMLDMPKEMYRLIADFIQTIRDTKNPSLLEVTNEEWF